MIQSSGITPRPTLAPAEARLLLLTSRPALSDAQQALAAALVPQVTQWPVFMNTAWRKYTLSMVYKNLAHLDTLPPEDMLKTMRAMSLRMAMEVLRRQAAFDWFHGECVLPSGVEHAYFKGPALAARFYPDPMQRYYRDVDILVPARQRTALMRRLRDQGCRVFHETVETGIQYLELDSDSALDDYQAVTPVPHVMTPQGLALELHTQIDEGTALFDTRALLREAREVTMPHHRIRVVPDAAHFVFICYHHTRHVWSKLHWMADLDAFCAHPEFDRDAVRAHARRLRLESTVDAALDLHDHASTGRHPSEFDRVTPGVDLLRACIEGLSGDEDLEHEMRKGWRMRSLVFDWQPMPISPLRQIWLKLLRYRPVFEDLHSVPGWPRVPALRYACALTMRFVRGSTRHLTQVFQR